MSCQAKVPVPFIGGPVFFLCAEPTTAVYHYRCACGRHTRLGENCAAHEPVEGGVGCARCFTELGAESHECLMTFAEVDQAHGNAVVIEAPGGLEVCDLCGMPAVPVGDGWMHGEAADSVVCALLFPRGRGVGPGGSE